MSAEQITILATFGGYMVLLFTIGVIGDRKFGKSYQGFVAADKSLGGWVTAISAAASSESAWVMLGLSGLGYSKGPAGYWAALGCVLGFVFTAIFIIVQTRRSSQEMNALTVTDFFERRLGDKSKILRLLSSLIIVFFLMCYVVAQFVGSGKQMSGMQLMTYQQGVLLGGLIIGIYVVIGGYAAVCWTDLVQGILMALVMLFFPIFALIKAGGFGPVLTTLEQHNLTFFVGGEAFTWLSIGFIIGQLGIGLGYPGMPHSLIRYITVKNDKEAKKAAFLTVIWGLIVLFGSVSLGIIGRTLLPELSDPEKILPAFTASFFHPVIAGLVLAAITAAIMSTADSQLMISATSVIHDIYYRFVKPENSVDQQAHEKSKVRSMRVVVGLLALIAMMIALIEPKVIYTFVLFAWGALGAAFTPVVILTLYWKNYNRWGALASLICGPLVIIAWKLLGLDQQIYELVPGFFLSLLASIIVSLLTAEKENYIGLNRW